MACGELTEGFEVDCDNIPAAGTRPVCYVINQDDMLAPTVVNGIITQVNLVDGAFAYKITGLESAFKKSEDFSRSANTGLGSYKHKAGLVIYSREQNAKDNIVEPFGNGRFVFIMMNRGTDDDAIEMLGRDVGMRLVPGTIRDQYANDGLYVLSFATPEGEIENEKSPQQTVFDTDQETTIAMLDALLPTS